MHVYPQVVLTHYQISKWWLEMISRDLLLLFFLYRVMYITHYMIRVKLSNPFKSLSAIACLTSFLFHNHWSCVCCLEVLHVYNSPLKSYTNMLTCVKWAFFNSWYCSGIWITLRLILHAYWCCDPYTTLDTYVSDS